MRLLIFLTLSVCAISLSFAFPQKSEIEDINFLDYPAGSERKQAFVAYLRPLIEDRNRSLLADRQKLINLSQKQKLNIREQRWLRHISQNYGNSTFDTDDNTHWSALLEKIDIIPVSLALAQAAKESGWGSSRFAREANNYFGQWCYTAGCGLVPKDRDDDASHEVTHFESVKDSVVSYIHNLNTNPAYKKLRELRDQLRQSDKAITGYHLAEGLKNYSARGLAYISEIQALILNNKFGSQHVSR